MKVSVVSPFFNEEKVITKSVKFMVENLKEQFDLNWELILVNDGSTDNSLSELMAILKDMDETRVRVISYLTNQGRGHALKAGIDEATDSSTGGRYLSSVALFKNSKGDHQRGC